MARLILNRDGVDLGTHELVPDIVMIGRAPLNHIVIDDPTVSAHHARLLRAADSYWLADLHSTNGTQVNSVSIADAKLKDGDKIRFGSVVGVFCGRIRWAWSIERRLPTISRKPVEVGAVYQPWTAKGRTIWIADAHRDGQSFIVRANERLTAFAELEAVILSRSFSF
jgi:pSer/pThr/pTyr-binding forkhead associated (FHA) protein